MKHTLSIDERVGLIKGRLFDYIMAGNDRRIWMDASRIRTVMQEDEDDNNDEIRVDGRIYVKGLITEDAEYYKRWGMAATSAGSILAQLNEQSGDLEIWVNSIGGEVQEASAIAAELRAYEKGKLTAVISGLCASAATFIPIACSSTEIFEAAEFMIHLPRAGAYGEADYLRKVAANLDKTATQVAKIYGKKADKTVEEMLAIMREETYMGSDETLENGFADVIRTMSPDDGDEGDGNSTMSAEDEVGRLFQIASMVRF